MNKHKHILYSHVRFRRWSRAGYAVFSSLSKCVTIGAVCASICEMSCKKSNALSAWEFNPVLAGSNEAAGGVDEPEELLPVLQNSIEQTITNKLNSAAAVAAAIITNIYNYKPAVGMIEIIPTAFFMHYYEENFYYFFRFSIHYPVCFCTE